MRDLPGIYKESKHGLFYLFLFSTQAPFILNVLTRFHVTHAPVSHPLLLSDCLTHESLCCFLKKKNDNKTNVNICRAVWMYLQLCLYFLLINPITTAFCTSLHFWNLMRAKPDEGWPVFVCLWAKCHRICCVCLSCHCSVCRTEVDTASGWSESARCHLSGNRPCRAGSTVLTRGINFCLPYLPVKTPVTVDSLQQNIRADREEIEPRSSALPPLYFGRLSTLNMMTDIHALNLYICLSWGRHPPSVAKSLLGFVECIFFFPSKHGFRYLSQGSERKGGCMLYR